MRLEERLQCLYGGGLVVSLRRYLHGLAALDVHSHDGEEPLQVGALLPPGQLYCAADASCSSGSECSGVSATSADADSDTRTAAESSCA